MDIIKNQMRYSVLVFLILPLYAEIDYSSEIQPIFNSSCISCHSGSDAEEDLSLTSYDNIMNGGDSGDVVIPYDHTNSLLWQYINSGFMPPYGSGNDILTTGQINLIAQWINEGALPESNELMPGDVNEDEVVNVLDVVLLVNSILNGDSANDYPQADLNDDGLLNVLDVVLIVNIILN
jgi:mono/diheme cytochrome c family protein